MPSEFLLVVAPAKGLFNAYSLYFLLILAQNETYLFI